MNIKKFFQKIRVPLNFLVAGLFLFFSRPDKFHMVAGFLIAIMGLTIRQWASGHIVKSKKLTKSGPYKYTRNPLYLGSFFIGMGLSIQCGKIIFMAIFIILFLIIYIPVMKREEEEMEMVFKDEYLKYKNSVPLFFPLPNKKIEANGKYDFNLMIKNKEYKALIGFIIMEIILLLKLYL